MADPVQPSNNPATQSPAPPQSASHDTVAASGAGSGANTEVVGATDQPKPDHPTPAQRSNGGKPNADEAVKTVPIGETDTRPKEDRPQGPGHPPQSLKDALDRKFQACQCNAVTLPHFHTANGIEEVRG